MSMSIDIIVPVRTVAGLNAREHHLARSRRVKKERTTACIVVKSATRQFPLPVVVTMTRLSAGKLDDDNIPGACKAIRDGIADAYGIDDAGPEIQWRYAQQRCSRGAFGVLVRIEPQQ